jgi:hypothetical protein
MILLLYLETYPKRNSRVPSQAESLSQAQKRRRPRPQSSSQRRSQNKRSPHRSTILQLACPEASVRVTPETKSRRAVKRDG